MDYNRRKIPPVTATIFIWQHIVTSYHRVDHAPWYDVCIDRPPYWTEIDISDNGAGFGVYCHNVNIFVFLKIVKAGIHLKLIHIIIRYSVQLYRLRNHPVLYFITWKNTILFHTNTLLRGLICWNTYSLYTTQHCICGINDYCLTEEKPTVSYRMRSAK